MFVSHFDCWLTKPPWTALIHIYHCLPTTSVVINQLYLLIIFWDHHPKKNMKPTSQIFRVSPSFVLAISQCLWVERQCACLFSLVWYLICLSSGNQTWQWKNPHEWCYHWISLKHPSSSGIFHCHVPCIAIFDLCGGLWVLFPGMPCVSFFSKAYFISAKLVPESPGFFRDPRDPRLPVRHLQPILVKFKYIWNIWKSMGRIIWLSHRIHVCYIW